jgi:mRNA interferase RelE/StbE
MILKVGFRRSFVKDLERVRDASLKERVRETIAQAERALAPQEIGDLKKLRGGERYYQIRLGEYRIGLTMEGDKIVFVRFLPRKDIYRYFP